MDIDVARSIIVVVGLAAFLGIVAWAYSGKTKARFDEAAQLPFADDDR